MTTPKKISALVELTTPAVGDLLAIVDISEAFDADKTKKIQITNLGNLIPTLLGLINVGFAETYDNGDSGATETIDWEANGNVQKTRMTDDCTYTFTDPTKPCALRLILIGDGTQRTPVWDSDLEFVTDGDPAAGWGDMNNKTVGVIAMFFDPSADPKYLGSGAPKAA